MIIFCIIEFGSRLYLRSNRSKSPCCQLLLVEITGSLCQTLLLIIIGVDARAILGPSVVALSHALRRIMVLPEQCKQVDVGDLVWTEDHPDYFSVASRPTAHLLVSWILCKTS